MTQAMKTLADGYRGLSLLAALNWDRILFPAATGVALTLCAYLMTL